MFDKKALEVVSDWPLGFYSCLILVKKASGGCRPVISFSPRNGFTQQTQFRMETTSSVLKSIRKGYFMALMNLKDTYFQMLIVGFLGNTYT